MKRKYLRHGSELYKGNCASCVYMYLLNFKRQTKKVILDLSRSINLVSSDDGIVLKHFLKRGASRTGLTLEYPRYP
jgi:hypothetical protein